MSKKGKTRPKLRTATPVNLSHMKQRFQDAEKLLSEIKDHLNVPAECDAKVGAFVNVATSILEYAKRHVARKKVASVPSKEWLKNAMKDKAVGFFRKLRVQDFHFTPVKPVRSGQASILQDFAAYGPSPNGSFKGGVVGQGLICYENNKFAGWQGPERFDDLCSQYLEKIRSILIEGERLGHLTH